MVKLRLRCDLIFNPEDEEHVKAIVKAIQDRLERLQVIRRGEPAEEKSWAMLEKCRHDEEPPGPCEELWRVTVT